MNNKDRYLEVTSPKSYGMERAKRAILEAKTTPPLATFTGELKSLIESNDDCHDFSSFCLDGDVTRGYGFVYFTDRRQNCIKEYEISTGHIRIICETFKGWSKPCGIFNLTRNNQKFIPKNSSWTPPPRRGHLR